MPYSRPELIELRDTAYADIERIPGADARLAFGNLNVLAHILAGATDGLYGYVEWLSRQLLPDSAEDEYLDRHASIWLEDGRKPAKASSGGVIVEGVVGVTVPVGAQFVRGDGVQFAATNEVTLAALTATVQVQAMTAGAATNTAAGAKLTLVSPIAGLSSQATVDPAGLVDGSDIEKNSQLRGRILQRIQEPPQGGSSSDYVKWAKEVPGVTRAWVAPLEMGAGTVTLRFVRDGDVSPIPDPAEISVVQSYIDARRPVTAELYVVAPVAVPVLFQIQLTPGAASVKAAVEAELRDLILRESAPGQTLLISHIREAISIATGEVDHVLASPTANVVHAIGEMATFGGITWI